MKDATEPINYKYLINEAMLWVVKQALKVGLEKNQCNFFITFFTNDKNVIIPDSLKGKYPEKMSIIIEHQFYNFKISEENFSITLSFNKKLEHLTIPFKSMIHFHDNKQKFSIGFTKIENNDNSIKKDSDKGKIIFLDKLKN